ncbi:MAG: biotin-dependent carboxyltransferase family protein [Limisphaerales bacterium]
MPEPVLEVLVPGPHASLQDAGRRGWRRFGVPPGGALDAHARHTVNTLLGNPPDAPVLELLPLGVRLRVLRRAAFVTGGADGGGPLPRWRVLELDAGAELAWPRPAAGVWSCLGVRGGFAAPLRFGGVSPLPAAGVGSLLRSGDRLAAGAAGPPPRHIGGRWLADAACRDYTRPPVLRLWPGPQWEDFSSASRQGLFAAAWRVSARSSRAGYRLEGPALEGPPGIVSEPVLVGSIQVPPGGQPIVTLHDGPTVGGYAKLGLIEPEDLPWLVQVPAGREVRFTPNTAEGPELP